MDVNLMMAVKTMVEVMVEVEVEVVDVVVTCVNCYLSRLADAVQAIVCL